MKLFVDDVRAAPEGWELASSAEKAIRIIAQATMPLEAISLDHDAGIYGTFQPVAYFIGEKYVDMPDHSTPRVYIHSGNPRGSEILRKILYSYGITAEA